MSQSCDRCGAALQLREQFCHGCGEATPGSPSVLDDVTSPEPPYWAKLTLLNLALMHVAGAVLVIGYFGLDHGPDSLCHLQRTATRVPLVFIAESAMHYPSTFALSSPEPCTTLSWKVMAGGGAGIGYSFLVWRNGWF